MPSHWKRWSGSAAMREPDKVYPISGFAKGGLLVARPPKTAATAKPKPWMIYHEPTRMYFPFGDLQRFTKLHIAQQWVEELLGAHPELDWTRATATQIVDDQLGFRPAFLEARDRLRSSH